MRASEIAKKVNSGELKAQDLIAQTLAGIKEKNPSLNAFLEIFEQDAISRAKEIDALPQGQKGRLAGVPVAIKDNILYKGHICSCASKMLENYKAPYTATVVEKLLKEGAIIVGRTNMDEFAMGSSNENSAFGPVKNPLDTARVPGGSSGGSAAAVASGMVPVALGSDTGGSIRQPASFCGVVGMKPTYGSVSRFGLTAFASSADQIGPITNNIEDNELVLSVISGEDKKDSTSLPRPQNKQEKQDIVLGVPSDFLANVKDEAASAFKQAVELLKSKGVEIKEVSLHHAKYAAPCYHILTSSEASSNLARFDGLRYGYSAKDAKDLEETYLKDRTAFGPEVKRRIILGTFSLSSAHAGDFYLKAQKVRELIKQDFQKALKEVDAIIMPTTPSGAFKIGEVEDILTLYLADLFTCPANMAGVPALTVPFGKDKNNMPLGLQICANYFDENILYKVAALAGGK